MCIELLNEDWADLSSLPRCRAKIPGTKTSAVRRRNVAAEPSKTWVLRQKQRWKTTPQVQSGETSDLSSKIIRLSE